MQLTGTECRFLGFFIILNILPIILMTLYERLYIETLRASLCALSTYLVCNFVLLFPLQYVREYFFTTVFFYRLILTDWSI